MRLIDIDEISDKYILNFIDGNKTSVGNIRDLLNCQPIVTDRWIPIEKQLPKKEGSYLVTILDLMAGTKYVDRCYFFSKTGKVYGMDDETHWFEESNDLRILAWQPLPTPYEEHQYCSQ